MEIKGTFYGEWFLLKEALFMLINGIWLKFKLAFLNYKYRRLLQRMEFKSGFIKYFKMGNQKKYWNLYFKYCAIEVAPTETHIGFAVVVATDVEKDAGFRSGTRMRGSGPLSLSWWRDKAVGASYEATAVFDRGK